MSYPAKNRKQPKQTVVFQFFECLKIQVDIKAALLVRLGSYGPPPAVALKLNFNKKQWITAWTQSNFLFLPNHGRSFLLHMLIISTGPFSINSVADVSIWLKIHNKNPSFITQVPYLGVWMSITVNPRCSMYGMYGIFTYKKKKWPSFVGKYSSTIEHLGIYEYHFNRFIGDFFSGAGHCDLDGHGSVIGW